jgi:hypothetical protein
MTATVDSEAVFDGRMTDIGLSAAEQAQIRLLGWTTHAKFAFSSSYAPGQADDHPFLERVVTPVLGAPDHPSAAMLRRLLFESYTLSVQQLRSQLERSSDDAPKKLPAAERANRLARLRARLPTLKLEDGLEPSHRLVDLMTQMHDDDYIHYIEWSDCTARRQEIQGEKKTRELDDKVWKPDASGVVRQQSTRIHPAADVGTDYKFRQMLSRRGLAFDLAGLLSYETHEILACKLMDEMSREPLIGYLTVSREQLERADRHVFMRLSELTRLGIRRRQDGTLPLENAMKIVVTETSFQFLLMPLQAGAGSSSSKVIDTGVKDPGAPLSRNARRKAAAKAKAAAAKTIPVVTKQANQGPKAKGKGKGIPQQLQGLEVKKENGENICFGFNLGTCSLVAPGLRCPRGWHCCMIKKCNEPHPYSSHR